MVSVTNTGAPPTGCSYNNPASPSCYAPTRPSLTAANCEPSCSIMSIGPSLQHPLNVDFVAYPEDFSIQVEHSVRGIVSGALILQATGIPPIVC